MDALEIIVPFVGVIIGGFIGYFLNQALYEKKRRDELADRESARRAAITDMRIQEVREYIDNWSIQIQYLEGIYSILKNDAGFLDEQMKLYVRGSANLPNIMKEWMQKISSVDMMNDAGLEKLNYKLHLIMHPVLLSHGELFTRFVLEDSYNIKNFDVETLKIPVEADNLIIRMKKRLDELAITVK